MNTKSTRPEDVIPTAIDRFVGRLERLEPGPRARFKRNAGVTLAESRGVLPDFYRILPRRIRRPREIEDFFLVATLHGMNPGRRADQSSLARSFAELAARPGANRDGIDRRLAILIDSHRDELPFRLRQAVRLLASHEIRIDWRRLLHDLLRWESTYRPVQKTWAHDYFGESD